MKITFYSTFLTVHQVPFCNEMYCLLGDDFHYVSCEKIYQSRLEHGYKDLDYSYPYVVRKYEDDKSYEYAKQLSIDSDVVIIGSAPEKFCRERLLKYNKLTFRYSERILKQDDKITLKLLINLLYRHISYIRRKCYLLAAGAYSASDFYRFHCYKDKAFKWGYFTETVNEYKKRENDKLELLWAGRMISWKHPEFLIDLVNKLHELNINFHLNVIGDGDLHELLINRLISDKDVTFVGVVENSLMKVYYQKSDLFLMTSDRQEGWGAVINEALSNGCPVVASKEVGSVPWLIQDNYNGKIYPNNSYDDFEAKVIEYALNRNQLQEHGYNAYLTMKDVWSAEVAAKRFIECSESLLNNELIYYDNGPCSSVD